MATTSKKTAKTTKAKPRQSAKKSQPKQTNLVQTLRRDLAEALDQQAATSEILRVIAGSPTDSRPVFETILANTTRLCDAHIAALFLYDGEFLTTVAHHGTTPEFAEFLKGKRRPGRETTTRLAALERKVVHVLDLLADPQFSPPAREIYQKEHIKTVLSVPMLRENHLIGVITTWRREVRPFTENQIALLKTFADQAVIAIENVRLFQELKESLEQQTATSEILGVIASSPTDIQPVLDVVAENATRVCGATDAVILRVEGNNLRRVAHYGPLPGIEEPTPISRGWVSGRATVDRQTIHVHDVAAEVETEFPDSKTLRQINPTRTMLATPLLREGVSIGVIGIRRLEVKPFTEKQITLLKTFADQAVIAIENVRLFKEIQERNAELREALEHQTATAEVLGIISRSPTDVQPVLDAIVESAARVCGIDDVLLRLREGNALIARAHFGPMPIGRVEISMDDPQFRWMREHGTLHVPDVRAQNDFPMLGSVSGWRTFLVVPLRQQGELIGGLTARRIEVRPFTPTQIKLLETFADQAVIAIENVRLFNELKESLEQQTATSEILGVIASSPTDIQPVLDTVAENAARVCGSYDALIRLVEGDKLRLVAHYGPLEPGFDLEQPLTRDSVGGRAVLDRELIHIEDLMAVAATEFPEAVSAVERMGGRTILAAPLLREGVAIGVIFIRRTEVRPFTDKQIALLKTFATQAVIAIENVRLFKELQDRNAELREALEHQTATAEVLGIISRSPTDVQPVLDAIVESAARVCGIDDVLLRLRRGEHYWFRGLILAPCPLAVAETSIDEPQYRWMREHGALHIPDVREQNEFPNRWVPQRNSRTFLAAPLRQQGELIGLLNARRTEVRPFTPTQIKLLRTFADQAVIAIENVRLFQELEARTHELARSVGELKALGEVGQAVSSTLDLETVLTRSLRMPSSLAVLMAE